MFRLMFALLALVWSSLSALSLDGDDDDDDPPTGDGDGDGEGEGEGEGGTTPPAGQPYRSFKTQREFEKAFGPVRIEGRDAEKQRWLDALGVETEEEAIRLVDAQRDIERDSETAAETARREKEEVERERDRLKSENEATETRRQNSLKRVELRDAMRAAGVRDDRIQRALNDADLDNLDIDDQDVVSGASEEAERIKGETPEWFEITQDSTVPSNQGRTGGGGTGGSKKASSRWLDRRTGAKR